MAKFTPSAVVILILLFTVISKVPQTEGGRCQEVLDPSDCVLSDCKKMCYQKHQSMGGQCVEKGGTPAQPTYKCVCVYDCPL
ncbi:low-molecular-weight cysteine-rich 12 [Hibiscus trionum]|uniref:Low-molecular-weight cysteine-rich 12 n=1 Tax=Hibiscus trionum TaxID=183268 RepID=A0A9W7MQ37_HIBTR|nr:low-molecular-weight cysteine-rich 12 [Hibiscus trionum]